MYVNKRNNDWENPYVQQVNREPMHSPWGAYASEEQALLRDRYKSPNVKLLDGTWTFHLASSPQKSLAKSRSFTNLD